MKFYMEYNEDNVEEIVDNLYDKGYVCRGYEKDDLIAKLISFLGRPMGISIEMNDLTDIGWSPMDFYATTSYELNDEYFLPKKEKKSKLVLGLGLGLVAGCICLAYKLRG